MGDYPDDFGQSIWPKYGQRFQADFLDFIDALTVSSIIQLFVNGVVSDIIVIGSEGIKAPSIYAQIQVDNIASPLLAIPFLSSLSFGLGNPYPWVCSYYNSNDDPILGTLSGFVLIGSKDIPVQSSFAITIDNQNPTQVFIEAHVGYYLVT